MSTRVSRRWPVAVALTVAVVLVWCAVRGWGGDGLLSLLPALLLGCALHARCYPGERFLVPARTEHRARWPRLSASAPIGRRLMLAAPHGGLLIGRSLAVRPPPRLSAAS